MGRSYALLASITAPIFHSSRISANIEIQDALLEQTRLAYCAAVLTAVEDVESALIAVANTSERRERLAQATNTARQTMQLAEQRYASGLIDFLTVLDSQRTREVGIRLAIGALEREVLLQFLIEAVVLSSLGGLIGIALVTVASIVLSGMMRVSYLFNLTINLLAFLFSVAIGVIFGYFPALQAARLNPIEALRHE